MTDGASGLGDALGAEHAEAGGSAREDEARSVPVMDMNF